MVSSSLSHHARRVTNIMVDGGESEMSGGEEERDESAAPVSPPVFSHLVDAHPARTGQERWQKDEEGRGRQAAFARHQERQGE